MEKVDPFDAIHSMLRGHDYIAALNAVLSFESGRIRSPYSEDLNHAWYVVGDAYYKLGDYQQALRAFKSSLRNQPNDCEAMMAVADCYSETGNPKMAKYYILKALKLGKNCTVSDQVLTYNLGNAYFDLKQYDLAILEYKKVNKQDEELYKMAKDNLRRARIALDREKGSEPFKSHD